MLSDSDYTRYAQTYLDTVFRVALGYVKNASDADDVTQSVFLRLWKRKPELADETHARRWLIRVAINESKRLLCSSWRGTEALDEQQPELSSDERSRDVLDALMRLKPSYQTAIYLHYYEGLSTQEIADVLHVPQNTVLTRLRRAREQLKKALTEVEQ